MPGKVTIPKNTHRWTRSSSDDLISTHKLAGRLLVNDKSRKELANPEIARRVAKAQTTKAINKGWLMPGQGPTLSHGEAENLKKGVIGMMTRIKPSATTEKDKIEAMDADKLAQLYQNNRFVFEVYFNYGGIEKKNGALTEGNIENAEFLIEEYERAFGPLEG